MRKIISIIKFYVFAITISSAICYASGTIDFEIFPDGSKPQDQMEIHDQFEKSHGIIFTLSNGKYPLLGKVGPPWTAFDGYGGADQPAPNQEVGQYFLTDDAKAGLSSPLIVTYVNPVKSASGVIIDIDFDEKWLIIATDIDNNEISRLELSKQDPETGNGVATKWSIDADSAVIKSLTITGEADASAFGLAFDNFSPSSSSFAPIANAGEDQIVDNEVNFDGSKSYDLYGGEIVSFTWQLNHRSDTANSINASGITPLVTDLYPGFYDVILTVTDNEGLTASDNMLLAVTSNSNNCEGRCLSHEQISDILECMELIKKILSGEANLSLKDAIKALETVAGIKKGKK